MHSSNPALRNKGFFELFKTAVIYRSSQSDILLNHGEKLTNLSYTVLGKKVTNCLIENTGGKVFTSGPTIKTLIEDTDRLYKEDGIWGSANFVMEGIENDDIAKFDEAKDYLVDTLDYSMKTTGKNRDYLNLAIKLTGLGHMDMFKEFNLAQTLLLDGMFKKYSISASSEDFSSVKFDLNNPSQRPVLTRGGIKAFLNEHKIEFTEAEIDEFIGIAKFPDSEFGKNEIGEVEFYHNVHAHYVFSDHHESGIIKKVCNLATILSNNSYFSGNYEKASPPPTTRPSGGEDMRAAMERCMDRTLAVVNKAVEVETQVLVDAEQSYIQKTLDSVTRQIQTKYHKDRKAFILNGYQSYLKSSPEHVKLEMERCKRADISCGLKLIRGAYMGEERKLAKEHGYESPIWDTLQQTHDSYNTNLTNILTNLSTERDFLLVASHNVGSCDLAKKLMEDDEEYKEAVRFAQLKGFSDSLTYSLKDDGYIVSKYLPYGPTEYLIPYLIRRGQESKQVMREHLFYDEIIKEMKQRVSLPTGAAASSK